MVSDCTWPATSPLPDDATEADRLLAEELRQMDFSICLRTGPEDLARMNPHGGLSMNLRNRISRLIEAVQKTTENTSIDIDADAQLRSMVQTMVGPAFVDQWILENLPNRGDAAHNRGVF